MKALTISRGTLELARAHPNRPLITIGRSPTCDVVLRAAGVAPIHFILEWIGSGEFDPAQGRWSLFDISQSADQSGEGIIIGDEAVAFFKDFDIRWAEDRLESETHIGGTIQGALIRSGKPDLTASQQAPLLEIVQIRNDSGAVEEVLHLQPGRSLRKGARPFPKTPQFRIQIDPKEQARSLKILLEEMPGAVVSNIGASQASHASGAVSVNANDLLEVRWKGTRFFVRWVPAAHVPKTRRAFIRDPLLLRLSLAGTALAFLCLSVVLFVMSCAEEEVPPATPPRIAKIEVKEAVPDLPPAPAKPAPPVEPDAQAPPEKKADKPAENSGSLKPVTSPAQAAAPRFKSPDRKTSVGLQSPTKPAKVDQLGILGALKRSASKGAGVKADRIMNEGIITESVSGDSASIVIANPPAGAIGGGSGGARGKSDLSTASTNLKGSAQYDAQSSGPIAGTGGKPGFQQGAALAGGGTRFGQSGSLGDGGDGSPEVTGGLDKETVRKIIHQARSQIRTCYEKALISNPKLAGRILYSWRISPAGPVETSLIKQSSVGSPILETCVTEVIRAMRFPAAGNGRPTTVIYPFVFQART